MSKALKLHVGQRWAFFTAAGERRLPRDDSIAGALVHLRNTETDVTPLCPRCLMQTEHSMQRDAYMCASPVCSGGVTGLQVVVTPRWRRWINWWVR